MPKITNPEVLEVLQNTYFAHHTIMHVGGELAPIAGGHKAPLILDPAVRCDDCAHMIPAGDPGSGTQFLDMHHEMIRVFRKLLQDRDIVLAPEWHDGQWHRPALPDGAR